MILFEIEEPSGLIERVSFSDAAGKNLVRNLIKEKIYSNKETTSTVWAEKDPVMLIQRVV